ncbi:MAG TPA: tandem-95 repeat protein, partial [Anaerolineaceae bacterium]|nr:tandem-95 repeat protein [Anaerolineaceae bacterium]
SVNIAHAVAVQADGKIVAAGYTENGSTYDFALARYNSDGSLDTTFSGDGLLTTDFGSDSDYACAVALQADGKIVAAGSADNGSNTDFALARYNPDGSLDITFSGDGKLTNDFGSGYDHAQAVAVQADGKIVAAGYASNGSNDDFALARYNPDGSLDTTFSGDGLLTTAFGSGNDGADAVAVQADGKIVAAGSAYNGSNLDFALARYTVVDGGSFTYDPNGQFEGLANGETAVETFSYVASDGTLTDTATVTLTINGLNDAPVAENQATETDEDTAVAITLVASDVDGDTLTWNAGLPVHGTLTGAAPNLTYVPEANWNGTDTFTFTVNDGELDSNIATVSITVNPVNDLPTADDQSVATDEDTTYEGTLTGSDIDGDDLSYAKVSDPTHGVVLVNASGVFTYTPTANYNGADSFTFSVSDGHGGTDTGTVSITVGPVNDVPVPDAGADQTGSEGQLIQFSGSYTDPGLLSIQAVSITWDFGDGITTTGTLTPTHTYADNGVYTVTLTVNDGEGGVASDTLLVTVENVAPELAPIADQDVIINEMLTLTEAYTDPGWLDTHTALVDWGDGFTDTIHLAAGLTGFDFTHAFDTKGLYTVTVTITDDDGGVGQNTFAVTVRKISYNIWLPVITRH